MFQNNNSQPYLHSYSQQSSQQSSQQYSHQQSHGFDTNIIYNMIIATTISSCVSALTTSFPKIFDIITCYFDIICKFLFTKKESCVNIVATIRINEYGVNVNFSQEYCAILSIIMKKNVNL